MLYEATPRAAPKVAAYDIPAGYTCVILHVIDDSSLNLVMSRRLLKLKVMGATRVATKPSQCSLLSNLKPLSLHAQPAEAFTPPGVCADYKLNVSMTMQDMHRCKGHEVRQADNRVQLSAQQQNRSKPSTWKNSAPLKHVIDCSRAASETAPCSRRRSMAPYTALVRASAAFGVACRLLRVEAFLPPDGGFLL